MDKADELKIWCMCYWRFKRHCPVVAMEYAYGSMDVMALTRRRLMIDTEVKISISDLKRDIYKQKHRVPHSNYFFFAVPFDLKEKALEVMDAMYPNAGLLTVFAAEVRRGTRDHPPVTLVKDAKLIPGFPRLTPQQMVSVVTSMSNSLCHVGMNLLELHQKQLTLPGV